MRDGVFIFDGHTHVWDASKENVRNKWGDTWIQCFYAYHKALTPDKKWEMDYETTFRKIDVGWYIDSLFIHGETDMALLNTTVLKEFFINGFHTADRHAAVRDRYPSRLIPLGAVDPRDGPGGLEEMERQVKELRVQGFKWYTAEWKGASKGWKANDPTVYPFYEKAIALGVKNMHFHKGPGVQPLSMEGFDVRDIDEPAALYPGLNFIVDHVGLPRLDDFCWIAAKSPNVYASMAVALAFVGRRPRYFAEIMANLLFWVGEDRIIYSTDFPIWYPHWQLEGLWNFQMPEDLKAEYSVDFTPGARRKIVGENLARLYGIDVAARVKELDGDELSGRKAAVS